MKTEIKFKGKRIDTGKWVEGYYFKTPLTDENSGTDPNVGWFFLTGEVRHCISSETGVVFVVDPESVEVVQELFLKVMMEGKKENLPKEDGVYFCNRSGFLSVQNLLSNPPDKSYMREIKWYLQPLKNEI